MLNFSIVLGGLFQKARPTFYKIFRPVLFSQKACLSIAKLFLSHLYIVRRIYNFIQAILTRFNVTELMAKRFAYWAIGFWLKYL